jgi:transposase InsO family protein
MAQFPFVIAGFHSDNGPEYINHHVASLLEKLRIEQTKSRSRYEQCGARCSCPTTPGRVRA